MSDQEQMSAREALDLVGWIPKARSEWPVSDYEELLERIDTRALPALREAVGRDERRAQDPMPALLGVPFADLDRIIVELGAYCAKNDPVEGLRRLRSMKSALADANDNYRAEVARLRERLEGAERSVENWKRECGDSDTRLRELRRAALSATRLWPRDADGRCPQDGVLIDALYRIAKSTVIGGITPEVLGAHRDAALKARADALAEAVEAHQRLIVHPVREGLPLSGSYAFLGNHDDDVPTILANMRSALRAYREEGSKRDE